MYLLYYSADIIVGFENSEYIISEGEMDGFVTIIRDQFDASFTVEVTAGTYEVHVYIC